MAECSDGFDTAQHAVGCGEGDNLDRRHHLPRLDIGECRQSGDGGAFVDQVDAVDPALIQVEHARMLGEQVDAAGERRIGADALAQQRLRDPLRRLVLPDLAGFEANGDNGFHSRFGQRVGVCRTQQAALFQAQLAGAHRMGQQSACRVGNWCGAEDHEKHHCPGLDAGPMPEQRKPSIALRCSPWHGPRVKPGEKEGRCCMRCLQAALTTSPSPRCSTCVICAIMAMAISAGARPPRFRPIGA